MPQVDGYRQLFPPVHEVSSEFGGISVNYSLVIVVVDLQNNHCCCFHHKRCARSQSDQLSLVKPAQTSDQGTPVDTVKGSWLTAKMCILFFQLNDKDECGTYRLVLANNRDEFWARPTSTAAYWGENDNCLSSLDQEPGREGGTWLGINKQGKIGVLLNILGENLPNRKGRGFLPRDFIASNASAETFLQNLSADVVTSEYNGFHLVLLEAGGQHPLAMYLTESSEHQRRGLQRLSLGDVHAFGNSTVDKPWQKVEQGRPHFQKIIEENRSPESKNKLVDSLLEFLNDKQQYTSDSVLGGTCRELGYPTEIKDERSANRVWSPSIKYGTRTNTVILMDNSGRCDYIERSLVTPVDVEDPHSTTETFSFKIDLTSS